MRISKIESAQRQLNAAIRLFFAEDDWIVIHTLASASGRILRDLAEQRGSSVLDMIDAHIQPAKRADAWREINKAANFFKHADRDPTDLLEGIDSLINDHLIQLNCLLFMELEKRVTDPVSMFMAWYTGVYPDLFKDSGLPIFAVMKQLAISIFKDLSRSEQLALGQALLRQPSLGEMFRTPLPGS